MATGKTIYRVLAAGCNDRICQSISELLPAGDYEPIRRAATAGETRRLVLQAELDIVIINAPLKDEFGTQLAMDLSEENLSVLLLVPLEVYEQVCTQVEDFGVVTLPKPVSRQSLYSSIKVLTALRGKLLHMDQKIRSLQEKMQDIRVINRAKWLLIENYHMTEENAHHLVEHRAMDMRVSKREAAEIIIRSFDP